MDLGQFLLIIFLTSVRGGIAFARNSKYFTMKPITQFALELATEYHKGQKRKDGKDYITHPIAVAEILEARHMTPNSFANELILVAGLAHDISEDCNVTEEEIVNKFIEAGYFSAASHPAHSIYSMLIALNKNRFDSYGEYITNLIDKSYAKKVKIADLTHNLSDLKPGSLRDKYELALYILTK